MMPVTPIPVLANHLSVFSGAFVVVVSCESSSYVLNTRLWSGEDLQLLSPILWVFFSISGNRPLEAQTFSVLIEADLCFSFGCVCFVDDRSETTAFVQHHKNGHLCFLF